MTATFALMAFPFYYHEQLEAASAQQSVVMFQPHEEVLERLSAIEEMLVIQNELLIAHIERDYVFDQVNCEYAEALNPEPEKYLNGMRIYDNPETAITCLYYRNPPGHIYSTPPGHVNPPGYKYYTNIDPYGHTHEDDEDDVPVD
jgi:hypothetical protein